MGYSLQDDIGYKSKTPTTKPKGGSGGGESVSMVQPAGLEPAASSFAGRRSNPTELWLRMPADSSQKIYFCKASVARAVIVTTSFNTLDACFNLKTILLVAFSSNQIP